MKDAIRKRSFNTGQPRLDRELGDLARDVSDALGKLVELQTIAFSAVYTEPLLVGFDHEPAILLAGRVRKDATPEAAVNGNARVCFVWNAQKTQLQVSSVDGCTVGVKYRFNFLAVG